MTLFLKLAQFINLLNFATSTNFYSLDKISHYTLWRAITVIKQTWFWKVHKNSARFLHIVSWNSIHNLEALKKKKNSTQIKFCSLQDLLDIISRINKQCDMNSYFLHLPNSLLIINLSNYIAMIAFISFKLKKSFGIKFLSPHHPFEKIYIISKILPLI